MAHSSGKTSLIPDAYPVDKTSVFRLASCTKLITAVALLRLLSQPPWSSQFIDHHLDDSSLIDTHLPELKALEVITSAPGNKNITYTPRTVPLTLRQLLTHTSGVGYDMIDPRLRAWRKSRGERTMTLHGPLPESVSTPLLFQPGEAWAYGGSLDWIGVFVERASGTKLGKWMREHLFDVLGCDAGIGFARDEVEQAGKVVQVVARGKEGRLKEQKVKDQEEGVERGGGGLYASASNMSRILADIISPTPKLLSPEIADLLFAPQLISDSPVLNALQASASSFRSMSGPLTPSNDVSGINHALGGMLVTKDSEELGKTSGTMTWGGAFNCMWFANRKQGVAGFYGSSMFPPGEGRSGELMSTFLREVWRFEAVGAGSTNTTFKQ
jgi:CubicO group peptidase (beta-lactamase class C family)